MFLKRISLLLIAFGACGQQLIDGSSRPAAPDSTTKEPAHVEMSDIFQRPTDCRSHISSIVCLVEPDLESLARRDLPDNTQARACLPGSAAYAVHFETVHDQLPAVLQQMFCSLKKIYIEQQLYASAYADTDYMMDEAYDPQSNGAYLGVAEASLGLDLSFERWATWKEQLAFGGPSKLGPPAADLPRVSSQSPKPANDLLYAHIVHEFAHLLDFANNLSSYQECHDEAGSRVCTFNPSAWAALSWSDSKRVKPEYNFKHRKDVCFYNCQTEPIKKSSIEKFYSDFARTNFINTYAASHHREDFADTFEVYMMTEHLGSSFALVTPEGTIYDLALRLRSEKLRSKYDFIRRLLASSTLKYP